MEAKEATAPTLLLIFLLRDLVNTSFLKGLFRTIWTITFRFEAVDYDTHRSADGDAAGSYSNRPFVL